MHSSGEDAIETREKKEGTGIPSRLSEYKDIVYVFNKYEIKVRLTLNNEFIGIVEVRVNKDLKGFHDVEEFYRQEGE